MAAGERNLFQHLRRTTLPRDGGGMTDGQLLECYLDRRDGAAFEALLLRHGPMVLGVCRRLLRNHHDAEDAFQAAFLVLVRRAASVVPREMVGNWLYGVAYRTALEARARAASRRTREKGATAMPDREAPREEVWGELRPLLDEELSRLPEKYRAAIVLCELEGKTIKEAARQLGLPQGTLAGRLARGRGLLAGRLSRRGLALSAASLTAALSGGAASACVPVPLVVSTVKAATAGPNSAGAAALTERVVRVMFLDQLKVATALLLAAGLLGAGALTYGARGADPRGGTLESRPLSPAQRAGARAKETWKELTTLRWYVPGGVAFVADGKTLVTAGTGPDGLSTTLWDVATGNEKDTFKGPGDAAGFYCLAVAPGGKVVATGDSAGNITRWDVAAGKELDTRQGHQGEAVRCVAFSPDGKTWASGGEDSVAKLWDVVTGKARTALEGHAGPVYAVAFSPDGKTLATGGGDNTLKLWDVATGKMRASLEGHTARVTALAYARDGKTLASGSADGTVRLRDAATGKEYARLKGQAGRADAVAFTPDGRALAATGYEKGKDGKVVGLVRLWETATGKEQTTLRTDMGLPTAVAFSPDGKRLVVGGFTSQDDPVMSNDGSIKVWELQR